MVIGKTIGDRVFEFANSLFMIGLIVVTLLPFWMCLVGSFSDGNEYLRGAISLWPEGFNFYNYKVVFMDKTIYSAFLVTIMRTLIGTALSVLFTALVSYGLSRSNLKGRNIYSVFLLISMFFSGGLIPYYLVLKQLGLIDSFFVYIIPALFSVWNMLIFQSYFREIPSVVIESARIDGAGEYRIFFQLILPLSKPVLAAIALFSVVGHWNAFYDSMIFTSSQSLETIQLFLYRIISNSSEAAGMAKAAADAVPVGARKVNPETIKMATMMVTTFPILISYPFLQKYFVKGVMIGSVKG
ncbi:carbohydrate ABC transporter permease [Paenibacillus pasadenensis]|uniref:carbohydrate ABC transporter permease n=1 Tax=Paenibacillus pasadenensis TaxID=217090 RepID=UPI002040EBCD|nr:carbohydrate ABC transporter permease [Paenibacillus pasadenensis]MCM3746419.1 carbohydrate ABC transporter permease [Paenibacillus pasadenensis]